MKILETGTREGLDELFEWGNQRFVVGQQNNNQTLVDPNRPKSAQDIFAEQILEEMEERKKFEEEMQEKKEREAEENARLDAEFAAEEETRGDIDEETQANLDKIAEQASLESEYIPDPSEEL